MPSKRERTFATSSPSVRERRRLWRKTLGDIGEEIVLQYLILNDWNIVCTKFRVGRSPEVDIIANSPDGATVFIEVKTRTIWSECTSTWFEAPMQAIDAAKQKRIISASRRFRIATQNCEIARCRYDVILLGLSSKLASKLADLKFSADSSLLQEEIDYQISEYLSGRGGTSLDLIHCQSAFVTNF